MTNLGEVLGWKHNHAPGIGTRNNQLTDWPVSLGARPTVQQIATWTAEYDAALPDIEADNGLKQVFEADKAQRLMFQVNFDQENRLRVLEGKPAVTKAQYRNALVAAFKALP